MTKRRFRAVLPSCRGLPGFRWLRLRPNHRRRYADVQSSERPRSDGHELHLRHRGPCAIDVALRDAGSKEPARRRRAISERPDCTRTLVNFARPCASPVMRQAFAIGSRNGGSSVLRDQERGTGASGRPVAKTRRRGRSRSIRRASRRQPRSAAEACRRRRAPGSMRAGTDYGPPCFPSS